MSWMGSASICGKITLLAGVLAIGGAVSGKVICVDADAPGTSDGTDEASKSYFGEPPCETIVAGDINGDCIVDFKDFAIMGLHWLADYQP